VGVLGDSDRLKEPEQDLAWLRAVILQALELVKEVAVKARDGAEGDFSEEDPDLHLLSALPEQADSLVKDKAEGLGFAYEHASLSGKEAYLATGQTLLERSDLLIGLWDAAPRLGVGEVGDVAEEAIRLGIPTFWIDDQYNFHLLQCDTAIWGDDELSANLASRLRLRLRSGSSPQPAELVVRVGVASLDSFVLPDQTVNQEVSEVLVRIKEIAQDIQSESDYAAKNPMFRLITTLVEETDQKVASRAMALGYKLQCILPSRRETCQQHFRSAGKVFLELVRKAERVVEIDGAALAQLEAERLLLLQCDVLIVISDRVLALGSGGQDRLLTEALQLEIPMVWVDARSPWPVRFVLPGERSEDPPIHKKGLDEFGDRLRKILRLPEPARELQQTTEHERMRRFLCARRRRNPLELPFPLFRHLLSGRWDKLEGLLGPDTPAKEIRWTYLDIQAVKEKYDDPFQWADRLANSFAGVYRSSFLVTYIFGAVAVLTAFLGIEGWGLPSAAYWFFAELVVIVSILAWTMIGRKLHWHERWMDCRHLAESLRQIQVLALIGRVPASVKVPAHLEPSDPRQSWFNWYFRALVRQAGLINARLNRSYLTEYCKLLSAAIKGQAEYHRENYRSLERVHRNLHFATQLIFGLAVVSCFLHVGALLNCLPEIFSSDSCERLFKFCAIVLPALGAAVGAIHHTGEFERLALRSQSLAGRLEKLEEEVATATAELQKLSQIASDFSVIMMSELVDWRFVFLDKNLDLPA
jgi:hypothetical protein